MISTSPNLYPLYTQPTISPSKKVDFLTIGKAIQDLPSGSETAMKSAYSDLNIEGWKNYSVELDKFEQIKPLISKLKEEEEGLRKEKTASIDRFCISIFAAVSIGVLAWQTFYIDNLSKGNYYEQLYGRFLALPNLRYNLGTISLIPLLAAAFYRLKTNNCNGRISELCQKIEKYERRSPSGPNHIYYESEDLDLSESRAQAQKNLACKTLQGIAAAGWSQDQIVNYGLLDRVTLFSKENPAFYAKCIELLNVYGQVQKEHATYLQAANAEFDRKNKEIKNLKDRQLSSEKSCQEIVLIEDHKNQEWYANNLKNINESYRKTLQSIEMNYINLKKRLWI